MEIGSKPSHLCPCCIFEFQLCLRVNILAEIQFKSDYHHLAVSDTTPNSVPKTAIDIDMETETHSPVVPDHFHSQVQDQVQIRALGGALDKGHGYMWVSTCVRTLLAQIKFTLTSGAKVKCIAFPIPSLWPQATLWTSAGRTWPERGKERRRRCKRCRAGEEIDGNGCGKCGQEFYKVHHHGLV